MGIDIQFETTSSLVTTSTGPISSLYNDDSLSICNYPLDLSNDPTKNHYVQFNIQEVIPSGYTSSIGASTQPQNNVDFNGLGLKSGEQAIKSIGDSLTSQTTNTSTGGTTTYFGSDIVGQVENLVGQGFQAVGNILKDISLNISPQLTKSRSYISLYMPDTLTAQHSADWQEMSLAELGPTVTTLRMISQLAQDGGIDAVRSGSIDSLKNLASTDPAVTALAGQIFGNRLGVNGQAVADLALKGKGYAINPQLQMIYRGTGFRSFSLSFTFTPKSKQEADAVNKIIQTFKYHHAPTLQAGKESSTKSMFLIPPSIFQVYFKINDVTGSQLENQYLPKYGDLVLKDIDVNYAPNGYASHRDGAPIQTQLTLQFQEIEIVDRDRLQKGYNGSQGGLR
jgi:hypothetical protein